MLLSEKKLRYLANTEITAQELEKIKPVKNEPANEPMVAPEKAQYPLKLLSNIGFNFWPAQRISL